MFSFLSVFWQAEIAKRAINKNKFGFSHSWSFKNHQLEVLHQRLNLKCFTSKSQQNKNYWILLIPFTVVAEDAKNYNSFYTPLFKFIFLNQQNLYRRIPLENLILGKYTKSKTNSWDTHSGKFIDNLCTFIPLSSQNFLIKYQNFWNCWMDFLWFLQECRNKTQNSLMKISFWHEIFCNWKLSSFCLFEKIFKLKAFILAPRYHSYLNSVYFFSNTFIYEIVVFSWVSIFVDRLFQQKKIENRAFLIPFFKFDFL